MLISSFEKSGKIKEAAVIYERIHFYSIKHEETIFRKDYFMQLLRLLIISNDFVKTTTVLQNEITFRKESEKCKDDGINLYVMDLLLLHLIMHDVLKVDSIYQSHM